MRRRPPKYTRTYTLFAETTLVRSNRSSASTVPGGSSMQSTAGSATPPPTARTTTTTGGPAMHGDDAQPEGAVAPANDNAPVLRTAAVDAALTRLAAEIGRQIAREHIRAPRDANDHQA